MTGSHLIVHGAAAGNTPSALCNPWQRRRVDDTRFLGKRRYTVVCSAGRWLSVGVQDTVSWSPGRSSGAGWKQERAAYISLCRAASPVRAEPGGQNCGPERRGVSTDKTRSGSRGARTREKGRPAGGDRARRLVSLLESTVVASTPFGALPSLSVSRAACDSRMQP